MLIRKSEHKIQSSNNDGLTIKLHAVPKMLSLLREKWVPKAFVVSFKVTLSLFQEVTSKLETDANILKYKVLKSIQSGQNVVVGNLLQSYKDEVFLYLKDKEDPMKICRSESERKADTDLEIHLIPALVKFHESYLKN